MVVVEGVKLVAWLKIGLKVELKVEMVVELVNDDALKLMMRKKIIDCSRGICAVYIEKDGLVQMHLG